MLAVLSAALRRLDRAELVALRERFVAFDEDPRTVALIDAEIARRGEK